MDNISNNFVSIIVGFYISRSLVALFFILVPILVSIGTIYFFVIKLVVGSGAIRLQKQPPEVFYKKKFTGEHLCLSFNKVLQNTSGRLWLAQLLLK